MSGIVAVISPHWAGFMAERDAGQDRDAGGQSGDQRGHEPPGGAHVTPTTRKLGAVVEPPICVS
jgi:hypothetical protein